MIDNIRIFDSHFHVYGRFKPREESLIDYMDRFGIDRAIITTLNQEANLSAILKTENDNNFEQSKKKFTLKEQYDHEFVLEQVKKHPDRLTGFFWFNPRIAGDEDWHLLKKYVNEYNFKGVKLQPYVDMLKVPDDLHELAEFCIDADIPLFMHSGTGFYFQDNIRAKDSYKLMRKHKDLKLILGHAAYTMEHCINCLRFFTRMPNVYFETSCSIPYGIMTLIKAMGAERVIYGSDAPAATSPDIEIQKIRILVLDESTLRKVFYDNVASLIGEN